MVWLIIFSFVVQWMMFCFTKVEILLANGNEKVPTLHTKENICIDKDFLMLYKKILKNVFVIVLSQWIDQKWLRDRVQSSVPVLHIRGYSPNNSSPTIFWYEESNLSVTLSFWLFLAHRHRSGDLPFSWMVVFMVYAPKNCHRQLHLWQPLKN